MAAVGISDIAMTKLLGYPSLVVGGFGVIELLGISLMSEIIKCIELLYIVRASVMY